MTNRGRDLLQRANDDPSAVDEDAIREAVRTVSPEEVPHVMRALGTVINDDEERAPGIVELLVAETRAEDRETRLAANRALVIVAIAAPDALVDELSTVLEGLEDDVAPVRAAALRALVWLSVDHADAVLSHRARILPRIDDDHPYVGRSALELVGQLGEKRAEDLGPLIEPVVASLVDPPEYDPEVRRRWARQHPTQQEDADAVDERDGRLHHVAIAASVIGPLAVAHPDAIADHVPALVDVIEREAAEAVEYHLLEAIQAVAETDPAAAAPAMETAARQFETSANPSVRETAAWTLTWLAAGDVDGIGQVLVDARPTIETCLESDSEADRGAALGMLSYLAERDPDAVVDLLPVVREELAAGDPQHRGMAVWTVAYAGESDDRERLAQCARSDPDEHVRAAADDALTIIEDRFAGPED